jgi:CBS domain-containing protein
MQVRDVMITKLVTVHKDRNLKDVLHLMDKNNVTKLPVVDDEGFLVGVVTDGMIADKLGREHNRNVQTTTMHASSVMEKDFLLAHPDEDLAVLLRDVGKPGLTMVPVVQGKKLVGVITKADLLPMVKSDLKVASLMRTEVKAVGPEERLVHARRLLLDHDIARLPVLLAGKIQGIITENEIARAYADLKSADAHVQKANVRELQVAPYMQRKVVTGKPDWSAKKAAEVMLREHVGGLPIVGDAGTIEGIVTRTDLIKTFA